jgi:hypothetical protein
MISPADSAWQRHPYRHFPTRDDLISAKLAAAGQLLAATTQTVISLRLDASPRRSDLQQKLIIAAMKTVPGGTMRLIESSRPLIYTAFVASVRRALPPSISAQRPNPTQRRSCGSSGLS